MTIEWHKDCLKNMKNSTCRKVQALNKLQAEIDKEMIEISILKSQIIKAISEGRGAFDSERYTIPINKKGK